MKPHGPKLNRDWIGLRVKLVREARNRSGTIAEGTAGVITNYVAGGLGIRFEADTCEYCQCGLGVVGMHREDFVILTPPDEWPDTRERGRR